MLNKPKCSLKIFLSSCRGVLGWGRMLNRRKKLFRLMSMLMLSVLMTACASPSRTIDSKPLAANPPVKARTMSIGALNASVSSQIKVHGTVPDSFDNSYWQFMQIDGQRMAKDDLAPVARFKVNELTGFTGCNRFVAAYKRDGLWLTIGNFKMGNQPCDSVLPQQQLVYKALSQVRSIRIIESNDYLAMLDANNKLLAELKPLKVKD